MPVIPLTNRLHHVGITVGDLPRAIRFWTELTGGTAGEVRKLDAPHLAALTGYPDVVLEVAMVEVAAALTIELVRYHSESAEPYDPGTAHAGNVHICFDVDDMAASWDRAVRCGAAPVGDGPVVLTTGPQAGGRIAYLRAIDGVTIELRAMPA